MDDAYEGRYKGLEEGTQLTASRAIDRAFGELRQEVGETLYDVVIDEGENLYAFGASRTKAGAFDIVAVDWAHPNYGYFAEGMLWIRSLHQREWQPYSVSAWTSQYQRLGQFLADFPRFRPLFTDIPEPDIDPERGVDDGIEP